MERGRNAQESPTPSPPSPPRDLEDRGRARMRSGARASRSRASEKREPSEKPNVFCNLAPRCPPWGCDFPVAPHRVESRRDAGGRNAAVQSDRWRPARGLPKSGNQAKSPMFSVILRPVAHPGRCDFPEVAPQRMEGGRDAKGRKADAQSDRWRPARVLPKSGNQAKSPMSSVISRPVAQGGATFQSRPGGRRERGFRSGYRSPRRRLAASSMRRSSSMSASSARRASSRRRKASNAA